MFADDGRRALTLIAFVGSVFSPYYARARRRDPSGVDPDAHCGLNVALYPGTHRAAGSGEGRAWAFSEYPRAETRRHEGGLEIGRNRVQWEGDELVVHFDELTAPVWFGRPLRGELRVRPSALPSRSFRLDPDDRHRWWPIAPHGRATVVVGDERFEGSAYLDANWGDEPLAEGFVRWQWSRAELGDRSLIIYDAQPRRGAAYERAMVFDASGRFGWHEGLERHSLPRAGWGLARSTRVDPGGDARTVAPLEDSPFYTRDLLRTRLGGQEVMAVHEALDMDQWRRPRVQAMLPVRMRRRMRPR